MCSHASLMCHEIATRLLFKRFSSELLYIQEIIPRKIVHIVYCALVLCKYKKNNFTAIELRHF